MLYVDKGNAHPPSIEIAKAKRVLRNTAGVEVCYDSLGQVQEASQLVPHLWNSFGRRSGMAVRLLHAAYSGAAGEWRLAEDA